MKKHFFKIILYLSLVFLIISLSKADYLKIPEVKNFWFLVISIAFLFFGFIGNAIAWQKVLNAGNIKVSKKEAIISQGLSIFAKYIPGKLWVIIGRASFISEIKNISKSTTSILSLNAQVITLWTGILIGSSSIFLDHIHIKYIGWFIAILIMWMLMTIFLFIPKIQIIIVTLIRKVFKRKFELSILSSKKLIQTLPHFILFWGAWVCGFFFLVASLTDYIPSPTVGLNFALAGTLGILVVISPGGLGVREGILTGLLVVSGYSLELATTISVTSRLWFLLGEGFVFLMALFLRFYYKQKNT